MRAEPSLLATLLTRCSLRHARREWRSTATLVVLVALGVATFLAVRLANRAASEGFAQFGTALTPRSQFILRAPAGDLPESALVALRAHLGAQQVELVPVVESTATLPPPPGTNVYGGPTYRLLGLDLVAVGNLGVAPIGAVYGQDFWSALRDPQGIYVSPALAQTWGLPVGATRELLVGDRLQTVRLRGLLPAQALGQTVPENLVVLDLPALQALMGRPGRIQRVEVVVPESERSEQALAAWEARLRGQTLWVVERTESAQEQAGQMTAAFRLNLQVLSLISLLVGAFLVALALDAAVARRRTELAILRSLGCTPRQLAALWTAETLVLGLLGTAVGLVLGWLLALGAVEAVARTVNALYHSSQAGSIRGQPSDWLWAVALGLGGSLLAAWLPVRDAQQTPPAQNLRQGPVEGPRLLQHPRLGGGLLLLAGALAFLPPLPMDGGARFPLGGYLAALALLLGGACLLGYLLPLSARLFQKLGQVDPALQLTLGRLRRPNGRHRLATAGLWVAVCMASAMSLMVGSFAHTMERWVAVRFRADAYLASSGMQSASAQGLIAPETIATLRASPGVVALDPFRALAVRLRDRETFLAGSDLRLLDTRHTPLWLQRPEARDWTQARAGADGQPPAYPAIANEAFLQRFALAVGGRLDLPTPLGPRPVQIVGLQADYGNERGQLLIDRSLLEVWFEDDRATNLSVYLAPGVDAPAWVAQTKAAHPSLNVRSQAELRSLVLQIFHETFAVTHALKLIALGVAAMGLALAQITLLREDQAQRRTLRALGFSDAELARSVMWEGLALGGVALGAGTLGGALLGVLLIEVINFQSFGWTLRYALPLGEWALLGLAVLGSGAGVSWLVGRRARHLPVEEKP